MLRQVIHRSARRRSPTPGLLLGLLITLAGVVAASWYVTRQIAGLRALQFDLAERNRKDSLQLLRIQNDLNSVALAMRDMLDDDSGYPLTAWTAQFARIRADLEDALRVQEAVAVARQTPEQRRYLGESMAQFWDAADRMFALARDGRDEEARAQIRFTLQARQASLSTAVARLLVENNEREEQTARRVEGIYDDVQRQVRWFLGATFTAILLMSLYLIRANRRIFGEIELLSERRRELAQQMIATREATLQHISRELHDELGQVLTAMGSMLGRAGRQAPPESPLRSELQEVREIAQATLEKVRELSQALHPAMLEDAGLEKTIEWYLSTVERQLGVAVSYERTGPPRDIDATIGIHVYRVLQEALTNVSRHAGTGLASVRLRLAPELLELEVEDHGPGVADVPQRRGLGIVTMRERAELVGGTIEFARPASGGTLVRLRVPLKVRLTAAAKAPASPP
jgi:signal transduction histidine kinase